VVDKGSVAHRAMVVRRHNQTVCIFVSLTTGFACHCVIGDADVRSVLRILKRDRS